MQPHCGYLLTRQKKLYAPLVTYQDDTLLSCKGKVGPRSELTLDQGPKNLIESNNVTMFSTNSMQGPQSVRAYKLKVALISSVLALTVSCSQHHPAKFNASHWRNASPRQRGNMVFDLLGISPAQWRERKNWLKYSDTLNGRNRAQVIEILGSPDAEYESGRTVDGVNVDVSFYYDVGYLNKAGFWREPCSLAIYFNDNHDVVFASISD